MSGVVRTARKLLPIVEAGSKLFGTYAGPHNIGRTGRKILMAPLKGQTLVDYFPPWLFGRHHDVWKFDEKRENKYWRNFRRWRKGHSVPKKGQGKKAQKRAKEAAKSAPAKAK